MELENLIYDKYNNISKITINRPDEKNSLTVKTVKELNIILQEADNDDAVRAIVLTGIDNFFCVGADLNEFSKICLQGAPYIHKYGEESAKLFSMGTRLKKPLIAAVNGFAVAGGLGLVAMSHIAIASENAEFGLPEIKVGAFPHACFLPLVRALGPRKALELSLMGNNIGVKEADRIGLINYIVPHDSLLEETFKIARKLCGYSSFAVRMGLSAFNQVMHIEMNEAINYYLNSLQTIIFMSEDFKEGTSAFAEKRTPRWKGN